MTSTVVYNSDLRTTCTHLKSGDSFETDAPVDNNGKGERFSPTDVLATSLATCMITVMGIKARTMGLDMNDVKIEVLKIMKADFLTLIVMCLLSVSALNRRNAEINARGVFAAMPMSSA